MSRYQYDNLKKNDKNDIKATFFSNKNNKL